jgi:hypothetical protein
MRRLFTIALVGVAVTAAAADVSAQGRGRPGRQRGAMDTARVRQADSLRAVRGDSARRRAPDSLRQKRLDSLRAAGALDSNGARLQGGRPGGPGGRGVGPMGGRGGAALMGIQLNDNEKADIKKITDKFRDEYQQLRAANQGGARGQNAQLGAQMEAIMQREQAEIRAALTAEHQAQFDANVAKRAQGGARGAPGAAGAPGRRPPRPPALTGGR